MRIKKIKSWLKLIKAQFEILDCVDGEICEIKRLSDGKVLELYSRYMSMDRQHGLELIEMTEFESDLIHVKYNIMSFNGKNIVGNATSHIEFIKFCKINEAT